METVQGRVLILAGAGSGKTSVLTYRMAWLIQEHKISPTSILGLTFTNKAAAEMNKRLADLIPPKLASKVTLSTFHSFCMQILREDIHHLGFTRHFTLYDQGDVERLLKIIARDILQHESELPSLTPTMVLINKARAKGLKAHELDENFWHDQFTKTVYQRLKEAFKAYNALDFDGLLTETVELFERFPDVLKKYQTRFQYIMIDEYQDTNPVQYRLAELLSQEHHNLCVVGDDDQSIYGWRGASIKNILEFQGAHVIKLEQNFRSTNTILTAANQVILHNKERHQKKLWSRKGEGKKIEIFHAPREVDEAEAIAYRISLLREKFNYPWSHFAILYRSNSLSRALEGALLKQRIPYQVFGGLEFYERKEVKDLIAYLRVCMNPRDQEALLRIVNYPRRGIGEQSLNVLTSYNRERKIPLWDVIERTVEEGPEFLETEIPPKALNGLKTFYQLIEDCKKGLQKELAPTLTWLIEAIDYKKAIQEEVKSDKMQSFKWENVLELQTSLEQFEDLSAFISHHTLHQNYAGRSEGEDKVTLMTFHSAKGLEFPICFLIGLEDHIIPHEKCLKEGGLEEERRLMYVAITRAKERLFLSMARERKKMGQEHASKPSRFLLDIQSSLLAPVKWDSFNPGE